jgi:hypothetical protein
MASAITSIGRLAATSGAPNWKPAITPISPTLQPTRHQNVLTAERRQSFPSVQFMIN